jgi:glycosyltransferase involved in cell wall biosynthesis
VVYPGIDCDSLGREAPERGKGPPVLLWNHRWEFDKGPEVFFDALKVLAGEGLDFRVRVLGENFQAQPTPFLEAREFLGSRLLDFGFAEEREDYVAALRNSDIVVSTSRQEFYGIAVLEGVYCGSRPLLPRRLSYPELFPGEYLYEGDGDFPRALAELVRGGVPPVPEELRAAIRRKHDVRVTVGHLDAVLEEAAAGKGTG